MWNVVRTSFFSFLIVFVCRSHGTSVTLNPSGGDDSAIIQNYLNAWANVGGQIKLSEGNFQLHQSLKLHSKVALEGRGLTTTLVVSGEVAFETLAGEQVEMTSVRNLRVDGLQNQNATVFRLRSIVKSLFENITADNFSGGLFFDINPTTQGHNTFANRFANLTMNTGKIGFRLRGLSQAESVRAVSTVVTLNSYENIKLNNITSIGIDVVSWSDHENWNLIDISLSNSDARGIVLRSSSLAPDFELGVNNHKFAGIKIHRVSDSVNPIGIQLNSRTSNHSILGFDYNQLDSAKKFLDFGALSYFISSQISNVALLPGAKGHVCGALDAILASSNLDATTQSLTPSQDQSDDIQIQTKIDQVSASGGGLVRLKPGRYRIGSTIYLKANVALLGSGYGTVLLDGMANDGRAMLWGQSLDRLRVGDFSVEFPKDSQNRLAVFDGIQLSRIENITATGWHRGELVVLRSQTATRVAQYNCFRNIVSDFSTKGFVLSSYGEQASVQHNEFNGIKILGTDGYGIVAQAGVSDNLWKDVFIWLLGHGARGVLLNGSSRQDFVSLTITQEPKDLVGGVRTNPSGTAGIELINSVENRVLGFSFTHWNWSHPTSIANGSGMLILNMVDNNPVGSGYGMQGFNGTTEQATALFGTVWQKDSP